MKKLLSIQGGKALQYIFLDKPSVYVPFVGDFPLAQKYQRDLIFKRITENKYLDEIPEEWIKEIIVKGETIYDIEMAFMDYLREVNKLKGFSKLKNSEKADLLVNFMDKNCITMEYLKL